MEKISSHSYVTYHSQYEVSGSFYVYRVPFVFSYYSMPLTVVRNLLTKSHTHVSGIDDNHGVNQIHQSTCRS